MSVRRSNTKTVEVLIKICCLLLFVCVCRAQQKQDSSPVSITLSQADVCVLGKQCDLKIVLKNVSKKVVRVRVTDGLHAGYVDYQITIKAADGRAVKRLDPFNYMNNGRTEYLQSDDKVDFKPDQSWPQDLLLGDVAKITAAGTYLVQLQRDNRDIGPSWTATSNELAVVVKAR